MMKTYYESKEKTLFYGLIIIIPLIILVINFTITQPNDPVYVSMLIKFLIGFVVLFAILILTHPAIHLEIYPDHFIYRKGKYTFSSKWSDVHVIAFQQVKRFNPTAFFIDSAHGTTGLIETRILRSKDAPNEKVHLLDLVNELEAVSGKKIKWGDKSVKKYSNVNFTDLLKSQGIK